MFLGRTHDETFVCNTELQTKVSSCVPGFTVCQTLGREPMLSYQ